MAMGEREREIERRIELEEAIDTHRQAAYVCILRTNLGVVYMRQENLSYTKSDC